MDIDAKNLVTDRQIAKLVGMSSGWVRAQRHYRRFGKPHILTIDPVLVGTKPRYIAEDVLIWFETLKASKPTVH